MKKLIFPLLLSLSVLFGSVTVTSCKTAPDQRGQAVTTLKILGTTAKNAMDASTQLLKDGKISVENWQKIANFYDTRFQPAFSVAVASVHADLSSTASPDLIKLASDFAAFVAQITQSTPH